jgi:hypothetical protein
MFYDVADRERTDYILGERGPSRAAAPVWSLPACLFGCRRRTRLRWFCPRHAGHAHGGPGKGLDLAPYIMKLGVLGLVCMDARAVAGVACVAPGALREAGALSAARAAGKEQAKRGAAASGKRARGGPADARGSAADGAPSSDALAAFAKVVKCARGSRRPPTSQPPDAQACLQCATLCI